MQQVVHIKQTEQHTAMGEPLTTPDSQSDMQEAIQSEQAKGTLLIQNPVNWSILETHWESVDKRIPTQLRIPVLVWTRST